jgi:glycosyltransferase involved in cell wall biosynthesis
MKMTVILFSSAGNTSGGSRQALYLAQGLSERGHDVLFFVPEHSRLCELAPGASFWRQFRDFRQLKRGIEAAMPTRGPTVIHAFHNAAVKRAAWWGLFWKKRAVVVAHRGVTFRPVNPLPYWSPGIDRFLVNSQACARILRGMGVRASRVAYVPNAVPDSRLRLALPEGQVRRELGIPADSPVLLSIGGNKPYKGVKELLQAFSLVSGQGLAQGDAAPHLIVLGISPELWTPMLQGSGCEGRAHLLGARENVGDYLAAATVFVLPSLSESMPNTLLEAIRAGLPCVSTDVGAAPDILEQRPRCGLIVPPGDVQALAQAMRRVMLDADLCRDLAAGAAAQADLYRPEKRLDLLESVYTELLRDKHLLTME